MRTYSGWGQPRKLNKQQAKEHAAALKARGFCGSIVSTRHAGWCVCDGADCEVDGEEHQDGRHMVVWSGS